MNTQLPKRHARNAHTPGPWITDDFGDKSDLFRHVMNGSGNGPVYIAKLPLTSVAGIKSESYASQEANARLIAAAPDLLDALQLIVLWDDEGLRPTDALINKARAAISKALNSAP